jgi:NAD(P)-dependent dehydrogenase (short-subunit alcohol dehydrogenase family)
MSTTNDMRERTCLVTGATSGIGFETAVSLAERGARVLMAGPDLDQAAHARARLLERVPDADVRAYGADLARMQEVRRLAEQVDGDHDRLHVLINNAGIYATRRQTTVDGYEATLAVNFLAPFLLTSLLHPKMEASEDARVVNVSSVAHIGARIDCDDPHFERRRYHGFFAYAASKLALLSVTRLLARRYPLPGPTMNALHPGVVGTALVRSAGIPGRMLGWAMPLLRAPARGAQTSIHLATASELTGTTGEYFVDGKPRRPSKVATDEALAADIFELAVELTSARWR